MLIKHAGFYTLCPRLVMTETSGWNPEMCVPNEHPRQEPEAGSWAYTLRKTETLASVGRRKALWANHISFSKGRAQQPCTSISETERKERMEERERQSENRSQWITHSFLESITIFALSKIINSCTDSVLNLPNRINHMHFSIKFIQHLYMAKTSVTQKTDLALEAPLTSSKEKWVPGSTAWWKPHVTRQDKSSSLAFRQG